jgi:AcrR family transcriptional regulator
MPNKPETRETILQAAITIFVENGLQNTTTRAIAESAGVHETTLFRHFESKSALLKAVMESAADDMAQSLGNFPKEWTEDLHQDLSRYARSYQQAQMRHERLLRLLIAESGQHGDELKTLAGAVNHSFIEHLTAYFEQAKLLGQIRPELDAEKLVGILTGMITMTVLRYGKHTIKALSEDYLDECLDVFIRGIAVR